MKKPAQFWVKINSLAIMVMAAGLGMGFEEVRRYCEGAVDLVVQLERRGGVRGVVEIWLPQSALSQKTSA